MAELPDLRIIWTDNLEHMPYDLLPGVYAVVGPIASHAAEPELQDALCVVAIRRNRRFGNLSPSKYIMLLKRYLPRGRRYIYERK